jgi:hypothetical protein
LLVKLYTIYKSMLLTKNMNIDEIVWYSNSLHYINLIKPSLYHY